MATIAITTSPMTYVASLGAMIDAHARLGELYESNTALGDYAGLHTRLVLAPVLAGQVELAGGRFLRSDASFASLTDVRVLFLPSFQMPDPDRIDEFLGTAAPFHGWLARLAQTEVHIGAVGASVFHLAAAGLLEHRECSVSDRLLPAFRARFPRVKVEASSSLSASGSIITCSRDWRCGELVVRLFSRAFSDTVAKTLAIREPPRDGPSLLDETVDPVVARAQLWMRDRFTRDFRISDLAGTLGVTHQALIRHFRAAGQETPRGFVQRLRAEAAASMLKETNRSISEIAQLVGYRNVAAFRGVFTAAYGLSPASYRKRERK